MERKRLRKGLTWAFFGLLLFCFSEEPAFAQRVSGLEGLTEGVQYTSIGFSEKSKNVVIRVDDRQRGHYFSVYKARTAEKIQDIPFELEVEDTVLKRLKRKKELEDEGSPGAVSPKDGSVITGIFNGKDLAFQVQAGTQIGFLDVIPSPGKEGSLTRAGIKEIRWDKKGKVLVIIASWEFSEPTPLSVETLHIYRFRPWKVRWQ